MICTKSRLGKIHNDESLARLNQNCASDKNPGILLKRKMIKLLGMYQRFLRISNQEAGGGKQLQVGSKGRD